MTVKPTLVPLLILLTCTSAIWQLTAEQCQAQYGAKQGEWRFYSGDAGSTKYSNLDQINKDNVAKLKVAWISENIDKNIEEQHPSGRPENTPMMIGGTVYTSSGLACLAALDPTTGAQKWFFNPVGYKAGPPANLGYVHRGFAYWTDGKVERLFIGSHDAHLWCVDAKTGLPDKEFGEDGKVNFAKAIARAINSRNYTLTSPPVICRDVVIVGSGIADRAITKEAPRGDIQGFDVRTGKPVWIFHSIPQEGEFGHETWETDAWKHTGNTNVWTCLTTDEELGYVYCPFGTPTDDWYGGHRHGDDLFGESLVCLDAKTGKRVWHFQTVHHGLWDYDLPAAPVLCDIKVDGNPIKAVAQITKTGFTWVFDRTNGKPVWPIEEKPVPQSTVPGEKTSPTQPHPTKPLPYELQGTMESNLIDFTPELRSAALEILNKFDHGVLFTPPSEKGTINLPGWNGGGNWWGASFDPETGLFYVPSITSPIVVQLVKPDPARSNLDYIRGGAQMVGGPQGLPLFKGPYGRITAINLNTGDHAWMVPHGDGQRARISQVAGRDVGPQGGGGTGPLLTKTLLFIGQGGGGGGRPVSTEAGGPGATEAVPGGNEGAGGRAAPAGGGGGGNVLRAFDKATGQVVAAVSLPGRPGAGSAMTYLHDGKQYIAIALGDGRLCALSLP